MPPCQNCPRRVSAAASTLIAQIMQDERCKTSARVLLESSYSLQARSFSQGGGGPISSLNRIATIKRWVSELAPLPRTCAKVHAGKPSKTPQQGGRHFPPGHYLAIADGSLLAKLYSCMLNEQLMKWTEQQQLRARGQAGFRKIIVPPTRHSAFAPKGKGKRKQPLGLVRVVGKPSFPFFPDKASWLMQGPQRERHAHANKTKLKTNHNKT